MGKKAFGNLYCGMVKIMEKIYRVFLFILIISLMTACAKDIDQTANTETEEYAVYSALIEDRYINENIKLIVIQDHTAIEPNDDLDSRMDNVKQNLPELSRDAIDNFRSKNQESYPLKSHFNLSVQYELISEDELSRLRKSEDFWQQFYKEYPGSEGNMTLSRVGFNKNLDQALVYVGNQSNWLAGTGYFVLLIKENNIWKVSKEVMSWIS